MKKNTRKDVDPEDTINRIKKILNKHNIKVEEKEVISYGENWFSIRLELTEIPGVGTNGKGISLDYAKASAYGELMERLQSGFLIHGLFSLKQTSFFKNSYSFEEMEEKLKFIQSDFNNLTQSGLNAIKKFDLFRSKEEYYFVNNNTIVDLPDWYIRNNCGSNGLCAGNTVYEALLQGINELQERYARKLFFEGKIRAPNIDEEYIKNLDSYKLIKKIEEKGYICLVKDFTCGGLYPVLGLVIVDNLKNCYMVSLGADYDLDICLQRCVTEAFQGRKFSVLFKHKLSEIFNIKDFFIFNNSLETNENYQSNVMNNTGTYPFNIFSNIFSEGTFLNAFIQNIKDNKELYNLAINKLIQDGKKVFIKDYSNLGFPTYRIYIPGISELCDLSSNLLNNNKYITTFNKLFSKIHMPKDQEIKKFEKAILKIQNIPFYKCDGVINTMLQLPFTYDTLMLEIDHYHILLSICFFSKKDYSKALLYLLKYFNTNNSKIGINESHKILLILLKYYEAGEFDENAENISLFFNKEITQILLKNINEILLKIPKCPDCDNCLQKEHCVYERLEQIITSLDYVKINQNNIKKILEPNRNR